jgi:predicted  nucleic acid-binding Zn-ribbon protein
MNDVVNKPASATQAPGNIIVSLFALALFSLAGLCALGLCCELSGCLRAAQPEKTLRSEPLLPKLKSDKEEPEVLPLLPEPLPSAPAPSPQEKTDAAPRLPAVVETMTPLAPAAPAIAPTPEPPAPLLVEVCLDPLVYPHPCAPQPLESPMLRNWKTFALCALLTAVAPLPDVQAQNLNVKDLESINKRLEQLEQKDQSHLESLGKVREDLKRLDEIKALRKSAKLVEEQGGIEANKRAEQIEQLRKTLETHVNLTQADLEKMNKRLGQVQDIKKNLQRLDALDTLQKDVVALAERLQAVEQKAPPANGGSECRGDIKKIEGMLSQVLDLQRNMQADVEGVRKDVSGLKKEVAALQGDQVGAKIRLDSMEAQLSKLADEMKSLQRRLETNTTAASSPMPGLERALDDIRAKLASIEQAILRLPPSSVRVSNAAPVPGLSSPAVGPNGRVLLENFYPEDMLFIVNGIQTRVAPNRVMTLDAIPAGPLSYEVVSPSWGRRLQNTTALAANETFRITAR